MNDTIYTTEEIKSIFFPIFQIAPAVLPSISATGAVHRITIMPMSLKTAGISCLRALHSKKYEYAVKEVWARAILHNFSSETALHAEIEKQERKHEYLGEIFRSIKDMPGFSLHPWRFSTPEKVQDSLEYSLIKEFHTVMFSKKPEKLNKWIESAQKHDIPELQS